MKPAFPRIVSPPEHSAVSGNEARMQLADWLTRADHPLTSRVIANRLWQHHFGRGIVPTPNDFGTRGEAPSHPELLDYLAARFVDSGWSVKELHRLIMRSRVYQLASTDQSANLKADPGNQWLWRFTRRMYNHPKIGPTCNLEHIKVIVTTQQTHAKTTGGVSELVAPAASSL